MRRIRKIRNLSIEEFESLFGSEWAGWSWADSMLYCPMWNRGFTSAELQALFFRCQQVAGLEAKIRLLENDLSRLAQEIEILTKDNVFYRRQLILEARLGLALCRLDQ